MAITLHIFIVSVHLLLGNWEYCVIVEGDKNVHRVTGLEKGLQYLFRLAAINQSGSGAYVQTYSPATTFGRFY